MLLKKSTGTRYIGDAIDNYQTGDVVKKQLSSLEKHGKKLNQL